MVLDFTVTEIVVTCSKHMWNIKQHFWKRLFLWKMENDETPFFFKWRSLHYRYRQHEASISWNQLVFRRVRKIMKDNYLLSARTSVHMEQLGYQWTDFHEIRCLSMFRNNVAKIQVSLKSEKNNGYFTWRQIDIFDRISISSPSNEKWFLKMLRKWNIFHVQEPLLNSAVYEVRWKNIVKNGRPQIIILLMGIARIPKATNTHSAYVIIITFPL